MDKNFEHVLRKNWFQKLIYKVLFLVIIQIKETLLSVIHTMILTVFRSMFNK